MQNKLSTLVKDSAKIQLLLFQKVKRVTFTEQTKESTPVWIIRKQLVSLLGGETGEFMSRINSRPFVMKEDEEMKTYEKLPPKQRQAAKLMANRIDRQINEMELLNTIKEGNLEDYKQGGQVKLYHFAPVDEEDIVVDPFFFGKQCYSKREKTRSSYPRTFFYVNLNEAENCVKPGKTLYSLDIPANKLYDI